MRYEGFWKRSLAYLIVRCGWFSTDDKYRAYYGLRIGPFLVVFSRWVKNPKKCHSAEPRDRMES